MISLYLYLHVVSGILSQPMTTSFPTVQPPMYLVAVQTPWPQIFPMCSQQWNVATTTKLTRASPLALASAGLLAPALCHGLCQALVWTQGHGCSLELFNLISIYTIFRFSLIVSSYTVTLYKRCLNTRNWDPCSHRSSFIHFGVGLTLNLKPQRWICRCMMFVFIQK